MPGAAAPSILFAVPALRGAECHEVHGEACRGTRVQRSEEPRVDVPDPQPVRPCDTLEAERKREVRRDGPGRGRAGIAHREGAGAKGASPNGARTREGGRDVGVGRDGGGGVLTATLKGPAVASAALFEATTE